MIHEGDNPELVALVLYDTYENWGHLLEDLNNLSDDLPILATIGDFRIFLWNCGQLMEKKKKAM